MANDITTLAIQIQSQEAERSLQTFNALMLASSQAAAKISNIAVNVDVSAAMAQIQALKSAAAGIKNLNIDSGIAVPTGTIAPTGITPDINVEALNELKNFFATTNSMSKQLREEMQLFDDAVKKLETTTVKVNTTGGRTVQVSKEYAAALREVVAAQKEMEQAIARADADGQAVIEADNKAAAIKQRLLSVQRELQKVTAALNDTHRTYSGNIMGLAQQEEALKNKVDELSVAYRKAQEEADKLGKKLDKSAAQADNARHKYQEAKETLDATPEKPMTEYSQGLQNFSDKAKLAGVQITKLASGINGITMMAGDAIPGISGLGRAISMFGMMNPYIATFAVAIGAAVATYNEYNKIMQDTAVAAREMATEQAKVASNFRKEAQERQNAIDRLTVLNSYDKLYDSEKEESRKIVERLTNAYKDLGIQYDELTGKVTNLSEVTANMGEQDRKRMIEEQREAVRLAKSAAATQLAESQRESVGWWKNLFTGTLGMDGGIDISIPDVRWNFDKNEPEIVSIPITTSQSAQGYADSQYDYINSAKSIEEKIDRVNEVILRIDATRQQGGMDAWVLDAKNFSEQLKKSREALLEYKKALDILKQMDADSGVGGGRSENEINNNIRALEAKRQTAINAIRTPEERYSENITAINELLGEREKFLSMEESAEVVYDNKKITAKEAQLEIEIELAMRTKERLAYEKQLADKLEAQKRDWQIDNDGNIIGRKNDAEKRLERNNEIAKLRSEIDELKAKLKSTTNASDATLLKADIDKKQLDLNTLQKEQVQENELTEVARLRAEETKKGYIWDNYGNIVRKKDEDELSLERQNEIAAVRARIAATEAGTQERYEAEEELRRLQIEEYNYQNSQQQMADSGLPAMQNEQRLSSTMIQGIEARSQESFALQARTFQRPENALNNMSESERRETEIRDCVIGYEQYLKNISDGSIALNDAITRL